VDRINRSCAVALLCGRRLEQNSSKQSKWGKLAREGHDVAWEFGGRGGSYTGRMLVDGELLTPSEATKKFLQTGKK
jgi:hypothetical protein